MTSAQKKFLKNNPFEVGDLLLHYRYGYSWSHPDSGEVCVLISCGDTDKLPLNGNSLTVLLNGEIVDTWRRNVCHL